LNSLKISNPRGDINIIELNSNKLTIGKEGVVLGTNGMSAIRNGILTSFSGEIRVNNIFDTNNLFRFETAISDNGRIKVGLSIIRELEGAGHRGIALAGDKSNTFTGDLNLTGNVKLNLEKLNGAIAVSANMNVKEGAQVRILRHDQFGRNVRVTLQSKNIRSSASYLGFHGRDQPSVRAQFHQLVVDGRGVLDFGGGDSLGHFHGTRQLIIDDLVITAGSRLEVWGWGNQRDLILVRKDSKNLKDALSKISFQGQKNQIHLVDYNKDYYEVSNAPEAATYGAAFGGIALVCFAWAKRRAVCGRPERRM